MSYDAHSPILVNAHWQLGPFVRPEGVNPVISPLQEQRNKNMATDKVSNLSQEVYLRYTVDSNPPSVDVELNSIQNFNPKKDFSVIEKYPSA